jgi:hypothetical protein
VWWDAVITNALLNTYGDGWLQALRITYAVLAALCAFGFVATLVIRWDELRPGERILRGALIGEHLTITYGGYVALVGDYPASMVATLLTLFLAGVFLGFVVWIVNDLAPAYRRGLHR